MRNKEKLLMRMEKFNLILKINKRWKWLPDKVNEKKNVSWKLKKLSFELDIKCCDVLIGLKINVNETFETIWFGSV